MFCNSLNHSFGSFPFPNSVLKTIIYVVFFMQTALRVWDCLFYEGSKILIRVALTLLILNKDKFLESKDFNAICAVFKVKMAFLLNK